MSTITIGIDLAKHAFSVCELEGSGRVRLRKDFGRDVFVQRLATPCRRATRTTIRTRG